MKKIYIKEKRRDVIRTRGLCVPKKVHAPKKTYTSVFTFGVHPSLYVACDPCQCSFVFFFAKNAAVNALNKHGRSQSIWTSCTIFTWRYQPPFN